MRNFQKKRTWRNIAQSKPFLIVLGIVILLFAWNVLGFWNKMRETAKNKEIAAEKVANLEVQKEKLSSDIKNLNSDEGKERVFRENYGLAKEGEDLIVVVDDKSQTAATADSSGGFFSFLFFWKNWFK